MKQILAKAISDIVKKVDELLEMNLYIKIKRKYREN